MSFFFQNPNLTQAEMCESVVLATKQIQKIHLSHYQRVQAMVYNVSHIIGEICEEIQKWSTAWTVIFLLTGQSLPILTMINSERNKLFAQCVAAEEPDDCTGAEEVAAVR